MKESMLESAKTKEGQKWMIPEILDRIEQKRKGKADEEKYREQVKKRCNEAKEQHTMLGNTRQHWDKQYNSAPKHKIDPRGKSSSKIRVYTIRRWRHFDGKGGHPRHVVGIHHRAVP